MDENTVDVMEHLQPDYELWKVCRELELLKCGAELLYRPFGTLSHGERTKVLLALLFSRENYFLLIDEPTNHLDMPTREMVRDYLNTKKGFLLVSHDRWLLDACADHMLVLNRNSIEVEKGNFSSWWENKRKRDQFEQAENAKLKREIVRLEESAGKTARWAEKIEKTKVGFDPLKEHDRFLDTRAYIGEKSRRLQQRRKNLEQRQQKAIAEKSELLKDREEPADLKLIPLSHHKETYVNFRDFCLSYGEKEVVKGFTMEIKRGSRILLQGSNGCGKSSILKSILTAPGVRVLGGFSEDGFLRNRQVRGTAETANGLLISYINQDTSFLRGRLEDHIEGLGIRESLFKAVLRQLDMERVQFEKPMEEFSEGQKKKVLITGSLLQQAHLYLWDEPLNYIDVFSRIQVENLILKYQPTMLVVEHDGAFGKNVATEMIRMQPQT